MGRKKYSKELKARIALDAIKGQKTIAELASEYGVHANQISLWKKQLLDAAPTAFSNGKDKDAEKKEVERDHLYQKVWSISKKRDLSCFYYGTKIDYWKVNIRRLTEFNMRVPNMKSSLSKVFLPAVVPIVSLNTPLI